MEEQTREQNGERDLNALLQEDSGLQSQFDRLVSKALTTARANWEQDAAGRQSAEQAQALTQREEALALRERMAGAADALGERGLPAELRQCLNYRDDESVRESLDAVEKAFNAQVQKAVGERLKGTPPKSGGQAAYTSQMRAALGLK